MVDSTKITILLCLTILVTSILVMSYNEYVNRFSIIATQDNGIYIFDKKSTVLNRCENGKCITIPTNFPQNPLLSMSNSSQSNQQSQQYAANVTPLPTVNQQQNNNVQYNNQANNEQYDNNQNNNVVNAVPQVNVVNNPNNN